MTLMRRLLPSSQLIFRISPPFRHNLHLANVRNVKVKRPWVRRFFTTCLLYGAAIHIWSSFVLVKFDDPSHDTNNSLERFPEDEQDERMQRKSAIDRDRRLSFDKGQSAGSDSVFIPLSWPRLRDGDYYAASDPEWQTFIKIARDRERLKALKDELVSVVLGDASQSGLLLRMIGGPFTVTGSWLVHHFPSRAPPVYYRSGLELTDAGTSWVSKAMSDEDGGRLQRCIQPLFVTLAVRDAYLVFWRSLLSRFNFGSSEDEPALTTSNLSYKTSLTSDFKALGRLGDLTRSEPQNTPSPSSQSTTSPSDDDSRLHPSIILSTLQRLPLPKFGPGSDLYAASLAFKRRLNECWARELHAHRRGTFYIAGPVGLKGSKGFCRIEVKGEYDPITCKWISVSMQLKDLSIFNQRPLGGL
ncbi:hypothetical protein P175DRAFT_0512917 [Aspergillus ochraceoroseus IBT 24754]|uniref:Uncharacterized protein n=3 Tax=Aspergillus subgen. Nidulantes TaxID=2720870 RepID=A0A0F8TYS6_9EURO|nr:uncharacterized protein P175DRAFT_0512917 [Aspergillus ochraceoroseus IBT 24754]KKK12634.1 hypothetical protein ARAM_002262 [Aspergillus rambellii]KKK23771.1 hypothetical protein AOCH_000281 [Aspergillus ochraceoroseus]PTU23768.1 hypothetical protein P175DRAFT_0512917 [Aspergillus ochraceoroseus IBT 24754]